LAGTQSQESTSCEKHKAEKQDASVDLITVEDGPRRPLRSAGRCTLQHDVTKFVEILELIFKLDSSDTGGIAYDQAPCDIPGLDIRDLLPSEKVGQPFMRKVPQAPIVDGDAVGPLAENSYE
jgi:hypothetical protein